MAHDQTERITLTLSVPYQVGADFFDLCNRLHFTADQLGECVIGAGVECIRDHIDDYL